MNPFKNKIQNQGFTLIELMLAVAFLGLLMVVAMPNLSQFVQKQKLKTQAEIISSTFSVARSEALNRLSNVLVCWNPKSANANFTVIGYQIQPGNMAVIFPINASTAEVVRDVEYDIDGTLTVDDETDNCATYSPQGRLNSMTGNSLVFGVCRMANELKDSQSVEISATGRPVVKKNQTGNTTQKIACS